MSTWKSFKRCSSEFFFCYNLSELRVRSTFGSASLDSLRSWVELTAQIRATSLGGFNQWMFKTFAQLASNNQSSSAHFNPPNILLPGTLCPSTHFAFWNTFFHGTFLCFLELFTSQHFVSWNTLLLAISKIKLIRTLLFWVKLTPPSGSG